MHVTLLDEWEKDALVREAQAELGGGAAPDQALKTGNGEPVPDERSAGAQGRRG